MLGFVVGVGLGWLRLGSCVFVLCATSVLLYERGNFVGFCDNLGTIFPDQEGRGLFLPSSSFCKKKMVPFSQLKIHSLFPHADTHG